MISGRGSNLKALHAASLAPDYPAMICGVLSDHAEAGGVAWAEENGIPVSIVERGAFASKADHEAAMDEAIREWDADMIAMAGFMRVLSADLVAKWQGRIINIHPSLLPKHRGLDTHARALAEGDTRHGCTVHHVTAELDGGPVIAQAEVAVLPDDTADTLAARVLIEEHKLYPAALADCALKLIKDRA